MGLTLCDPHGEGTARDFNRALTLADKHMHHESSNFLRTDLELNQAMVTGADLRCRCKAIADLVLVARLKERASRVILSAYFLCVGSCIKRRVIFANRPRMLVKEDGNRY